MNTDKHTHTAYDHAKSMTDELMSPAYCFQGNGSTDTIICPCCRERIKVEDAAETRDGHFRCSECCERYNDTLEKAGNIKILQNKLPGKRDNSFWYDGEVAQIGEYFLVANGEITVDFPYIKSPYESCRFCGYNAAEEGLRRNYFDEDLAKISFNENNWFEVVRVCDTQGGCFQSDELGDTADTYDEGLRMLKRYFEGNILGDDKEQDET